jgi:2-aminoethylphosphonate-pyruvate transaminase
VNVIILAAGVGARLGARTATMPKPAVVVAGRPLLAYDVGFARATGAARIAVVVGAHGDITGDLARVCGAHDIIHNPRWADAGNLQSLFAAVRAGLTESDFLIMNADHIYSPAIAARVAEVARGGAVTAFIDHDRLLGPDDMKVRLDDERKVVAIGKQLDSWDAGYVGLTFVPAGAVADYLHTAENVHREKGDAIHVESVLARMAGVDPAATTDVSGLGWVEVDDEADFARAEEFLARKAWYVA